MYDFVGLIVIALVSDTLSWSSYSGLIGGWEGHSVLSESTGLFFTYLLYSSCQ